ncbi:uncharacterized protein KY384_004022 [Bacidia gigantensis]|uniref:uncharacterized protein n=1 Tax=Bacidia gigantensis TaxID=2732470 RepID=UPI001D049D29|nr:uncharacterized protein KY384_004022 [Bacidia gigantensis]KAG8530667.1 hypothetical protein KY384_004022 [Bacidia gigantensis]
MDGNIISGATFESPSRLVRRPTLNTIMEDRRGERREEQKRQVDYSTARLDDSRYLRPQSIRSTSPVPSLISETSSVSSYYYGRRSGDFDDVSDIDSEIDPSIMTDQTSLRSVSPDNSPPIGHKPKYPTLAIPSPGFWPAPPQPPTQSPPRPPKIPLSPAALSMLGDQLPSLADQLSRLNTTPSLTGSLSTDPYQPSTGPTTPESQTNLPSDEIWDESMRENTYKVPPSSLPPVRPPKPKISVNTQGVGGQNAKSGLTAQERISVYDFAAQDFPDSPVFGEDDDVIHTGVPLTGVELPLDALVTLQHLSLEKPSTCPSLPPETPHEMRETFGPHYRQSPAGTPVSRISDYSISNMSIPSPGGFFASLGSNARHTWHMGSVPASALSPSSATAEQFYKCPWNTNAPPSPPATGHVFELDGSIGSDTATPPTARQATFGTPARSAFGLIHSSENRDEDVASPVVDYDDNYENVITEAVAKSMDKTTDWIAQQGSYLSALRETNPRNSVGAKAEQELRRRSTYLQKDSMNSPMKKAVRFLESETSKHEYEVPVVVPEEPIYYEAFRHIKSSSKASDPFIHRLTRSDSIQSVRLCMPHEHLKRLKGEYRMEHVERPNPLRPVSMFPGKETEQEQETTEQQVINRVERERQALDQVNARAWIVEAGKYLAGGSLLNSPARFKTIKTPKLGDIQNGRVKNPARILDLGGVPNGDWAWHCAQEFPHARIYTATTEQHLIDSRIQGPRNHRRTAITELWKLPYPDHHFHVISARTLHTFLKTQPPESDSGAANDSGLDEYDLTLRECLRCLKPGGYLEFSLMDAEIIKPGTLGSATSVEFAFNLKTRGYDPAPTKSFLRRIRQAGFDDIKRAWSVLPMGSPTIPPPQLPETPPPPMMGALPPTPPSSHHADSDNENGTASRTSTLANKAHQLTGKSIEAPKSQFRLFPPSTSRTSKAPPPLTINTSHANIHHRPLPTPPTSRSLASQPTPTPSSSSSRQSVEAVQGPIGTTADAATLSGLVGSWAWEQWMLRLETEMGHEVGRKGGLLDGVGQVLEEGKHTGAGWRCLTGWGRKPFEMDEGLGGVVGGVGVDGAGAGGWL